MHTHAGIQQTHTHAHADTSAACACQGGSLDPAPKGSHRMEDAMGPQRQRGPASLAFLKDLKLLMKLG